MAVLRSRTPWFVSPLSAVNSALTLTMHMAKFAALLTAVGVIFMKSSSPKCCLASRKLNSIWKRKPYYSTNYGADNVKSLLIKSMFLVRCVIRLITIFNS